MTTQATKIEESRRGVRTQLLMTALTLAVLGSVALWQVRPGGEETAAPGAGGTTQIGVTARTMPGGSLVEPYPEDQRARSGREAVTPTVSIVESHERAQALLAAVDEENAFRATLGEPPLVAEVVWFDSAEAEAQFWATHDATRLSHGGSGAASLIIDLRGQATAPGAAQAAVTLATDSADTLAIALGDQGRWVVEQNRAAAAGQARVSRPPHVVYLVESVERQRELTELGLDADELVLVVTTDEDAAQVRLGQGRPEVSVIDLRGRSMGTEASRQAAAAATARDRSTAATSAGAVEMVYLVISPEQADWIRRFTYEIGQVSGQLVQVAVLVLPHTADASERSGLPGTPGARVFDLRTP